MSDLTADQWEYLNTQIEKKRENIVKPYKTIFGMDRSLCKEYFHVDNATFYKPQCRVEKVKDDQGYVRAWFTGAGIISHPVRYAWVPLSVIQDTVSVSLTTYCYFKVKNWAKKLFHTEQPQ